MCLVAYKELNFEGEEGLESTYIQFRFILILEYSNSLTKIHYGEGEFFPPPLNTPLYESRYCKNMLFSVILRTDKIKLF